MSGSPRPSESASGDGPIEFSTRFVELKNAEPHTVLPYVLAVLDGLGLGSAHAVEGVGAKGGILLTTPVGISHFLESTITKNLDSGGLKPFIHSIFYPPAVIVPAEATEIQAVIGALKLLPPDMDSIWLRVDNARSAIVVSGPPTREPHFKQEVLPRLRALAHNFEKPGFPLG
jgi:hypothetical protein